MGAALWYCKQVHPQFLLALKGIQIELFADLRQSSEATQQRQAALAQRERQLAALRYEQGQLEALTQTKVSTNKVDSQ